MKLRASSTVCSLEATRRNARYEMESVSCLQVRRCLVTSRIWSQMPPSPDKNSTKSMMSSLSFVFSRTPPPKKTKICLKPSTFAHLCAFVSAPQHCPTPELHPTQWSHSNLIFNYSWRLTFFFFSVKVCVWQWNQNNGQLPLGQDG